MYKGLWKLEQVLLRHNIIGVQVTYTMSLSYFDQKLLKEMYIGFLTSKVIHVSFYNL